MRIEANLAYGSIPVGSTADRILRIYSEGTQPITVTGLTGPSGYTADWTNGVIMPGSSVGVTVRFSPTEARSYNGTVTVQADQTSGGNTTPISGAGLRDPFRRSGSGNTVFDMPSGVTRLHITGDYNGYCSNFVVHVGGRLVVNEILGACSVGIGRHYDGTHLVSGTVVDVVDSSGVNWSMEEIQ